MVENEVIFTEDVERIFGKRPWVSRMDELMNENKKTEEKAPKAETESDSEIANSEKPEDV